ncbi:CaiB/BaiF CoA transferase family protein [Arthrobacter sp. MA-N2]|uniref:CaiB/BaiF CoA transferase family protein n=1 Tax=Arthrobacter sp. MA-N2 TaxID=1101188 RepID=UPI000487BA3E|nr:CoA transferase [Arthrobacter sp. MA-N2]
MNKGLLNGARALDLTDETGFVCGKVLGELGVDVVKVERPGGDPSRLIPPFHQDIPGVERSLYWKAFNTGKRGVTLDIENPRGQEIFRELVRRVDFVIESFEPGYLERIGLGFEVLRAINPKIVLVSITPFGQTGPYSQYKGSELIAIAMSGVLNNTGDPDRAPVKESLDSGLFHAGVAGAMGAVTAYYHAMLAGEGQQVDVSVQEVAASRLTSSILAWDLERVTLVRDGHKSQMGPTSTDWFWACKDGHLFWHMLGGAFGAPANKALSDWMDEYLEDNPLREVQEWMKFDKAGISQEQWDRFAAAIRPFFLRFTKDEIREQSLKRGTNATVANDPHDLLESEQLRSRGYWTDLDDPVLGDLKFPKYFFQSRDTENFSRTAAPQLGEHNEDIYLNELGLTSEKIDELRKSHAI